MSGIEHYLGNRLKVKAYELNKGRDGLTPTDYAFFRGVHVLQDRGERLKAEELCRCYNRIRRESQSDRPAIIERDVR
ncbi:MAG: hypothetical protein ACOCTT_04080 [archaeon]